jgi:transposase InsO family protein
MPDAELVAAIRAVLAASPFHGEGHRKVWARLRHAGVRTSKRRVLRLMGAHDLLAPSRAGAPRGPRAHDGTIIPDAVDIMWGTDLTTTITGEGQAAVFIAIDHCSAECVGVHAALRATRFEALEPIRQGVRRHFGGFAKDIAHGLAVRHDHGSQYVSHDFQRELRFLGIESPPAFTPRAGGQRLRRAVHPHPEGKPVVGADLRHRRGAARGAARLPRDLQLDMADRTPRLQAPQRRPAGPAFNRGPRRIGCNSVSHHPRAVQKRGAPEITIQVHPGLAAR